MKDRLLGSSGLQVSELCLGTMIFGTEWGWCVNREESQELFRVFASAGGPFLDTADCYTDVTRERVLGDFLIGGRAHFVVGTKYSLSMHRDQLPALGLHVQRPQTTLKPPHGGGHQKTRKGLYLDVGARRSPRLRIPRKLAIPKLVEKDRSGPMVRKPSAESKQLKRTGRDVTPTRGKTRVGSMQSLNCSLIRTRLLR